MKISVKQNPSCTQTQIEIVCREIDENIKQLVDHIKLHQYTLVGQKDNTQVTVLLNDVFYFDTVDNKTFVYMNQDVLQNDKRLYELEELLQDTSFVRINKSCIVNTKKVVSVKALTSGRLEAVLQNGEKVVVSKHYLRTFRDNIKSRRTQH